MRPAQEGRQRCEPSRAAPGARAPDRAALGFPRISLDFKQFVDFPNFYQDLNCDFTTIFSVMLQLDSLWRLNPSAFLFGGSLWTARTIEDYIYIYIYY